MFRVCLKEYAFCCSSMRFLYVYMHPSKSLLSFCLLVLSVTKRGILISPLQLWICLLLWGPVKFCFIFYEFILLGTCKLLKLDLPDDLKKNIMKCLPLSFVMLFAFKYALSDMIRLQLSFCGVWMVHLLLSSFLETNNFCTSLIIIRLFFFSSLTVSSFNQVI